MDRVYSGCPECLALLHMAFLIFGSHLRYLFYFDFEVSRIFLAAVALAFGFMNGSLYGLVGLAVGYLISRATAGVD